MTSRTQQAIGPDDSQSWEPCHEDCPSYGAWYCEGEGHDVIELQACDACERFDDDDDAAVHFVRQLQKGDPYAVQCARDMIEAVTDDRR